MNKFDWDIDRKKMSTQQTTPEKHCWGQLVQCFKSCKTRKASPKQDSKSEELSSAIKLKKNNTESDFFLYELAKKSEILSGQDTANLGKHLPSRSIGFEWQLIYSTTASGFSLSSLYRKMKGVDLPVLLVIKDMKEQVFGAVLSCGLRTAENFYGDHDTFLFRCQPQVQVYKWSGNNFYFIQGKEDFISVGAENGRFGLWIDDNLDKGRTEQCGTFSSPPLIPEKDFKIQTLECWTAGCR